MGLAYVSTGVFRSVTPLFSKYKSTPPFSFTLYCSPRFTHISPPSTHTLFFLVGAAYEGTHKRTFLAMSIMIAMLVPIMLILILLYRKLGQLRKESMSTNVTELLSINTHSSSSDHDSASDKEDETEISKLLALEKNPSE